MYLVMKKEALYLSYICTLSETCMNSFGGLAGDSEQARGDLRRVCWQLRARTDHSRGPRGHELVHVLHRRLRVPQPRSFWALCEARHTSGGLGRPTVQLVEQRSVSVILVAVKLGYNKPFCTLANDSL